MMVMINSNDLIVFYMGLELQSLALYVLATFNGPGGRERPGAGSWPQSPQNPRIRESQSPGIPESPESQSPGIPESQSPRQRIPEYQSPRISEPQSPTVPQSQNVFSSSSFKNLRVPETQSPRVAESQSPRVPQSLNPSARVPDTDLAVSHQIAAYGPRRAR